MKRIIGIITVLFVVLLVAPQDANAQKHPFGPATVYEQTAIDTTVDEGVDTLAVWNELTFIDVTIDSTHTFSFDLTNEPGIGAKVYMKVEADNASDLTLSFDKNINATDETLTANKTSMIQLSYDGTAFNIVAIKQID